MDQYSFLHVRIHGRGRVTLSLPGGIARAFLAGRLSENAEAWHDETAAWVPWKDHPAVAGLFAWDAVPRTVEYPVAADTLEELALFPRSDRADALTSFRDRRNVVQDEVDFLLTALPPDAAQLPLIPLEHRQQPTAEFAAFVERSAAREERRKSVRLSGAVWPGREVKVFVAGATKSSVGSGDGKTAPVRWSKSLQGLAAAVGLLLLGTAVALFLTGRADRSGGSQFASGAVTSSEPPRLVRWDTTAMIAATLSRPNPIASAEVDLETNLRIAEAVTWQPATDFASQEQVGRSARKVDALRNSINLYRVRSWQLVDGTGRDSTPWLEPFTEARRIDDVINLMGATVTLLGSLVSDYRVTESGLVFGDSAKAARYNWLRHRADSLVHDPVELDSMPLNRAPRRAVTRLLVTLPVAIVEP